jgi:hypothetical protein
MAVADDHGLFIEIHRQRFPLSPSEGFSLAEALIRGAIEGDCHRCGRSRAVE